MGNWIILSSPIKDSSFKTKQPPPPKKKERKKITQNKINKQSKGVFTILESVLWQFAGHTAANNIEVCFNCHI
jgi:hypothetical protein